MSEGFDRPQPEARERQNYRARLEAREREARASAEIAATLGHVVCPGEGCPRCQDAIDAREFGTEPDDYDAWAAGDEYERYLDRMWD